VRIRCFALGALEPANAILDQEPVAHRVRGTEGHGSQAHRIDPADFFRRLEPAQVLQGLLEAGVLRIFAAT
jgi:hypothetical protein